MPRHAICRVEQLIEGRGWPARAGDRNLAVFLTKGQVHVLENQCLHVGSPIDGGPVRGGEIQCPWHGWTYDVRTGDLLTVFGRRPGLRTYACEVVDGVVHVELDDDVGD